MPSPTGINIDITAKQLIVGVVGIASAIIGLMWFVMSSYVTITSHKVFATDMKSVKQYKDTNTESVTAINSLLYIIQQKQESNYNKLKNDMFRAQEDQFALRRNILKSVKISKLTKIEKHELRQIEELMVRNGYLDPALLTDI